MTVSRWGMCVCGGGGGIEVRRCRYNNLKHNNNVTPLWTGWQTAFVYEGATRRTWVVTECGVPTLSTNHQHCRFELWLAWQRPPIFDDNWPIGMIHTRRCNDCLRWLLILNSISWCRMFCCNMMLLLLLLLLILLSNRWNRMPFPRSCSITLKPKRRNWNKMLDSIRKYCHTIEILYLNQVFLLFTLNSQYIPKPFYAS